MESEIRYCKNCEKPINPNGEIVNKRKLFCTDKCRTRYYSLRRYYRLSQTEEYKAFRKVYFKNWVDKNRAKFNKLMRPISKKHQANRRSKIVSQSIEIKKEVDAK